MYVLTEAEVSADLSLLDAAWRQAESFILLPDKFGALREWIVRALKELPLNLESEHFALLTSGTTGQPRVIVGARERAQNLAVVLHRLQESEPVRETILVLPLSYTYAFVNQWVWATIQGRRLRPTRGFGAPEDVKVALESAREAMLCLVGAQVPLLAQYFGDRSFPGIIRVHFAGGRFPQERLDVVRALFPHAKIFNNYGCAEAMPRLTLRCAEDSQDPCDIGTPLPGIAMQTNADGELLFRSPYGAVGIIDERGYQPILPDTWVDTGDLAKKTSGGTWRLAGRSSEVFKRYGEKISLPTLLATVLDAWKNSAVFYRERDQAGEEGHVLLLAPPPSGVQLRSILKEFRDNHARVFWPLRIESVDTLPLLPNGKIDTLAASSLNPKTIHWYQRI